MASDDSFDAGAAMSLEHCAEVAAEMKHRIEMQLNQGKIDSAAATVERMRAIAPRYAANRDLFVKFARRDYAGMRLLLDSLRRAGVPLMTAPPATYYEMLDERLPGHGEQRAELQSRGILLDGSTEGGKRRLLLQIFSQTQMGPVFFEFIQRKGDEGFGEGNFKALFESLERDQLRRGVIEPA